MHHLDIDEDMRDNYYDFLYNVCKVKRLLTQKFMEIPEYLNDDYPTDILNALDTVKKLRLNVKKGNIDEQKDYILYRW